MPRARLDHAFCQSAQCEPGKKKTDYYDTTVTGFMLEARASGGRSYYMRYQDSHGALKQHRIAAYGDITFAKAKAEAQRLRSLVTLGESPALTKAEKKAVPTYGELAQQHLDYAKTYQRSYDTTEMYIRRHILPKWAKKYVSDVTQPEVAKWLSDKGEEGLAPATVEKIRIIFNRSFELALRWNIAGVVKNPVKGIPRKPINNARERYINAAEAKRLMAAVQASRNTQLPAIVGMLLYTGARVSELLRAEWKHIDLPGRQWHIPTSKSGRPRRVPLSQAAVDILKGLRRFKDCPYVLPNPETKLPFVSIKHGWQKARDDAKLPGLRIHDLRHSCASAMINAGVDRRSDRSQA